MLRDEGDDSALQLNDGLATRVKGQPHYRK